VREREREIEREGERKREKYKFPIKMRTSSDNTHRTYLFVIPTFLTTKNSIPIIKRH